MEQIRINVLGPLTINGSSVTQSQRALVAALVLHRATGASADALADAVWGDSSPASARKSVQNQIARLRAIFGPTLVNSVGSVYRINATTDADEFDRAALIARHLVPGGTEIVEVQSALDSWTSEPYGEIADHPAAEAERARLEHVRSLMVEAVAIHHICQHDYESAISGLLVRTATHLLHERAWELLIAALHASGRRTDALARYDQFSEILLEQLNVEPSAPTKSLCEAVRADRSIDLVARFDNQISTPPRVLSLSS